MLIHPASFMRMPLLLAVISALLLVALVDAQPLHAQDVGATMTDQVGTDDNGNGQLDLGDTISYTVVISNGGPGDANGVNLGVTLDPNTTLISGSLQTTSLALDTSYQVLSNLSNSVPVASGLLFNDVARHDGHKAATQKLLRDGTATTQFVPGKALIAVNRQGASLARTLGDSTLPLVDEEIGTLRHVTADTLLLPGDSANDEMGDELSMRKVVGLARMLPQGAGDIDLDIGTLPAGQVITVNFAVSANSAIDPAVTEVCNQGTVTGDNIPTTLTDDPSEPNATDPNPTCTDLVHVNLNTVKSNNVGGTAVVGALFTWTIIVNNGSDSAAAFASGERILSDTLPSGGLSYGAPLVVNATNVTNTAAIDCDVDLASNLACVANGATVSIAPGGAFDVEVPVTPSATGVYTNPRGGGLCAIDPDGTVTEEDEGDNGCTDTVTVIEQTVISMTVDKTVGRDANVCATTNAITATVNTQVYYCVTIQNTGNVTLTEHHMVDAQLEIDQEFEQDLAPGGTLVLTQTVLPGLALTVTEDITNTVVVTSSDLPVEEEVVAQAVVAVQAQASVDAVAPPTALGPNEQPAAPFASRLLMPAIKD